MINSYWFFHDFNSSDWLIKTIRLVLRYSLDISIKSYWASITLDASLHHKSQIQVRHKKNIYTLFTEYWYIMMHYVSVVIPKNCAKITFCIKWKLKIIYSSITNKSLLFYFFLFSQNFWIFWTLFYILYSEWWSEPDIIWIFS